MFEWLFILNCKVQLPIGNKSRFRFKVFGKILKFFENFWLFLTLNFFNNFEISFIFIMIFWIYFFWNNLKLLYLCFKIILKIFLSTKWEPISFFYNRTISFYLKNIIIRRFFFHCVNDCNFLKFKRAKTATMATLQELLHIFSE